MASGQGGHSLCEPPASLGRAQSPRHPAYSRGCSQDSRRTLSRSCHQAQPVPCPGEPRCVLVPPSGPAQPGQGTRDGSAPESPPPSCGCGGWTSLCTSTPRDGPSLTVPCHQGPRPGPWGTAGSEKSRGLGRVPGEVKPGTGVGSSPAASQPSPGTGQSSAGTAPSPRAPRRDVGTGSTQVPARAESSPAPA